MRLRGTGRPPADYSQGDKSLYTQAVKSTLRIVEAGK
ncbi:hypothetical protein SUDANB178_01968 [Streptomyces sp. enrichment culture]